MRRDGFGYPLGDRGVPTGLDGGELRRVGVEAEADLAAALLDERREPIRKEARTQPLTLALSAEPAEKRGTLPP